MFIYALEHAALHRAKRALHCIASALILSVRPIHRNPSAAAASPAATHLLIEEFAAGGLAKIVELARLLAQRLGIEARLPNPIYMKRGTVG